MANIDKIILNGTQYDIPSGGSSYTAGEGIDITNDVISADTDNQNEVIASALVELHNDKADRTQLNNYQPKGNYTTPEQVDATVQSYARSETEAISVEKVDAAALNDLDERVTELEQGGSGGGITGITMNGSSVTVTSGVADLGTVITDKSDKQDVIDSTHKLSADLVDDTSTTNKFTKPYSDAYMVEHECTLEHTFTDENLDEPYASQFLRLIFTVKLNENIEPFTQGFLKFDISENGTKMGELSLFYEGFENYLDISGIIGDTEIIHIESQGSSSNNAKVVDFGWVGHSLEVANLTITPVITEGEEPYGIFEYVKVLDWGSNGQLPSIPFDQWENDITERIRDLESKVTALEAALGNISSSLDTINGEVV